MLVQRRVMRWKKIWKSFQAVSANGFIFSFTLLIALKLDHLLSHSWWFVFTPLWWLCHAIISRGRCSLPSPPMPHDENWTPFQYVMATPLLVAFEILLFLHLEDKYDDLKFVFLPLLAFEVAILVYNVRKCLTSMPRDEEFMIDEPLLVSWLFSRDEETMGDESLLYTWVSIWMVSFIADITFTLVKSRGATVLFVTYTSVVKSVLWIYNVGGPYGRYLARSLARVFLRFFQHCKRLLGWWSIDKESKDSLLRRNKLVSTVEKLPDATHYPQRL
ncbi:hypothetical protein F2Q69_00020228 [Brassica cretica]|uniref:Transmembrane protein n=1 Tax=Brassica cretica TaxID=69181 RepID=A0A8S9QER0_BRACR|nr:hypothetical protein F2Q69_00020228 [Brassica cretica]